MGNRIQKILTSKNNGLHTIESMKFPSFCEVSENCKEYETEKLKADEQIQFIISEAETKANEIIQNAQNEAEKIRQNALESGYKTGRENAIQETREEIERILQVFVNGLNEIQLIKDDIINGAESELIQLTIAIAEKIVGYELKQHPDTIIALIKQTIKSVRSSDEIVIKINPEDHLLIKQYAGELLEYLRSHNISKSVELRIENESNITPGGFVMVTDTNVIDMTFESRLDLIIEAFNNQVQ